MPGTYYRMMQRNGTLKGEFECWRVRDPMEHMCILAAKRKASEVDPLHMEAKRKSKPNQKRFTSTKETVSDALMAVHHEVEPGGFYINWLRGWLKWYIPVWRKSPWYPKPLSTPAIEYLCLESQLERIDAGLGEEMCVVKDAKGRVIETFSSYRISVS